MNSELQAAIDKLVAERLASGSVDIFREIIEPIEQRVCWGVIRATQMNLLQAAKRLNIARMTLRKKLREGITNPVRMDPPKTPVGNHFPD